LVSSRLFVVFILPIIFSIVVGTVVMADTLQKPDRELNMWPMSSQNSISHNSSIQIIGLLNHYSVSEPIEIQVKINDVSYSCGDLYITIYLMVKVMQLLKPVSLINALKMELIYFLLMILFLK